MQILGIDIGGSGIKGAPVDTQTGQLLASRLRIETPPGAEPEAIAKITAQIADHFDWKGPIGIGFPAAIKNGHAMLASNISARWLEINALLLFGDATGRQVTLLNDADAAGLAEMTFGAGQNQPGTVILITLGTGLGTAIFHRGLLLPNTELGHIEIKGEDAELRTSDAARQREDLSWEKYSKRLNLYLNRMEFLFWPDLFILGGGISKKHEKFLPLLTVKTPIVPAQFLNEAGIVGAALAARNNSYKE
jgi:polyphosphate glucokinase